MFLKEVLAIRLNGDKGYICSMSE